MSKLVNVPEGWQLVPVEVTDAMTIAAYAAILKEGTCADLWRAMLDAAPKPEGVAYE